MTVFLLNNTKNLNMQLTEKSYMFEFFLQLKDGRFLVSTALSKEEIVDLFGCDKINEVDVDFDLDIILEKIYKSDISILTESELFFLNNYK